MDDTPSKAEFVRIGRRRHNWHNKVILHHRHDRPAELFSSTQYTALPSSLGLDLKSTLQHLPQSAAVFTSTFSSTSPPSHERLHNRQPLHFTEHEAGTFHFPLRTSDNKVDLAQFKDWVEAMIESANGWADAVEGRWMVGDSTAYWRHRIESFVEAPVCLGQAS